MSIAGTFSPVHEKPNPLAKVSTSLGTGSSLVIQGLYSLRALDFIDLLDDQVLLLGFAYNQKENLTTTTGKSGDMTYQVHLTPEGEHIKSTKGQKTPTKQPVKTEAKTPLPHAKSPAEMEALHARLLERYFSAQDAARAKEPNGEESKRESQEQGRSRDPLLTLQRVQSGEHSLLVRLPSKADGFRLKHILHTLRHEERRARRQEARQRAREWVAREQSHSSSVLLLGPEGPLLHQPK